MNHTLILGGRSYPLDSDQQLEVLEAELLAAARDGGRFVPVTLADGSRLSCLVTPGVSIAIEVAAPMEFTERDEESPAPPGRRLHAVPPPHPSSHVG